MGDRQQYDETDPRHHNVKLKRLLDEIVQHAREDVTKIDEPKAQAIFETTAEVCSGLIKALTDHEPSPKKPCGISRAVRSSTTTFDDTGSRPAARDQLPSSSRIRNRTAPRRRSRGR